MDSKLLKVQIQASCETKLGQDLYLCGNIDDLGNSNPSKSMRLITSSSKYPIWYLPPDSKSFRYQSKGVVDLEEARTLLVPRNYVLRYQYCLFEGGELKSWGTETFVRDLSVIPSTQDVKMVLFLSNIRCLLLLKDLNISFIPIV